jgi:hypothetical protein
MKVTLSAPSHISFTVHDTLRNINSTRCISDHVVVVSDTIGNVTIKYTSQIGVKIWNLDEDMVLGVPNVITMETPDVLVLPNSSTIITASNSLVQKFSVDSRKLLFSFGGF